jgi:hypothetical protein
MASTWKARLGNLWGGFRVVKNKALPLVSPGEFKISDEGTIELSARYDPPGSGWRALVVALITGVVVTLLAQATGSCAGPGWLLWYIVIIFIRRQPVTLNLETSESVVVDSVSHRLGFLTDFMGAKRWVAFEIKENFDAAVQSIRATMPAPISEGKIARRLRAATIFVFVAIGLFALMIFASIFFVMLYRTRVRP